MTAMTFVEKALARAGGKTSVQAGDVLDVRPDMIFSHDNSAAIRLIFDEIGATQVANPQRMAMTLDHAVPAPTTQHARNHAEIRQFVREQGIANFFEVGRGICHQVLSEEGLVLPGDVVFGADSHTTHFGWLGAMGVGVGRTEMAALWTTGEIWMRVPEAVQLDLSGTLRQGVTAKDISLRILREWGVEGGAYRSVEFQGDAISQLSLDERAVLPNMMAEFGAMCAYLPPDAELLAYVSARAKRDFTPLYPDADALYSEYWSIDVTHLEPQVARPHRPDSVVDVTDLAGEKVDQVFVGTCTNGRYNDLCAVAEIVRGRHVRVPLLVIPASRDVLQQAIQSGVLATLIEAGAAVATPGCGPCMGNHMGIPAPQERIMSTANRNFKGRMGTSDAEVYLASPYVAAATALTGVISDPREFLA